jgi:site-specific DNA-methyltransferase (adenine-specific)
MMSNIENFIGKVIQGDCLDVMKTMPDNSVDLIVTSPPYDNLRDYKGYTFDFENIANELFRIIKQGGVIVWIVNDATINGSETGTSFKQALYFKEIGLNLHDTMIWNKPTFTAVGSLVNRYAPVFEYMFIFSNGLPKTINLLADKKNRWAGSKSFGERSIRMKDGSLQNTGVGIVKEFGIRNNIWRYNTGFGYTTKDECAFEHPAMFPEKLAEDHILSWSNKNDIILDPLCGAGTTCKMAQILGRRWIGIEISPEYCEIARKRIKPYQEQQKLSESRCKE